MIDESNIVPLIERTNDLTGGAMAVKAISTKVGMGAGSISRQWQRWEQLGLLIKDSQSYRKVLS